MNAPDPWLDRLSELLDGELDPPERAACQAHVERCERCRELLSDLGELRRAARALQDREPERDLWPGIERELGRSAQTRPRWPWIAAFAAGAILALGAELVYRLATAPRAAHEPVAVAREDYMLLLHEPAGFGSALDSVQHAALVARYARWAEGLGARCTGGEELEPEGLELRPGSDAALPGPDGPRVGGYFLLSVRDREEALALARTCPHLEQGGWIELRRIARADHERDG
jgi:hypothetical protein